MNRPTLLLLLVVPLLVGIARADLTITQKVEGAIHDGDVTIKIKGDKARIDATPQITTLLDGSGDVINLMNDQKRFIRMSAEKMKAMASMAAQFGVGHAGAEKPKLTPTGKTETINGFATEEYAFDSPQLKGSYWIAKDYPAADSIIKQLQALKPEAMGPAASAVPDYRDLPGVPIRTRVTIGNQEFVTTITSIKQDPLPDSDFAIPAGFEQIKLPDIHLRDSKPPTSGESPSQP